jgi:hypothetical protein
MYRLPLSSCNPWRELRNQTRRSEAPKRQVHHVNTTRLGLAILCAACVLGILGDGLLRATPWGLNVTLLTVAVAAAVAVLDREFATEGRPHVVRLGLVAIAFSAAVAWRDSSTLKTLNTLGVLSALLLMTLRFEWARFRVATIVDYAVGGFLGLVHAVLGLLLLVGSAIKWREMRTDGWSRTVLALVRGALIALPILAVFGALLVSADVAFARLVSRVFAFDLEDVLGHMLLASFLAWIAAGFLWSLFFDSPVQAQALPRPAFVRLGFVEVATVLVALDILFAVFVAVQVPYLFGGESYARLTTGLTFSEYYRRGFFELVTVAALVVPLQLVLHWLLRDDRPSRERMFRALAGIQVALVAMIMLSAFQRLRVYVEGYGLTELRLYTTAFLCWIGVVFVWFSVTVLRGRRQHFATGAIVSAFAVVFVLNAVNPDALIVRTNLARSSGDGTFDSRYATSLSADAVPELIESLGAMGFHDRSDVARDLKSKWDGVLQPDLRSWSLSRWRARVALSDGREALDEADTSTGQRVTEPASGVPTTRPVETELLGGYRTVAR